MIIPALDLINSQIVRLFQGDFSQKTQYNIDPIEQALLYQSAGATWLHLVDLDGAKNHENRQLAIIRRIIESSNVNIQIGGGIRTEQDLAQLLEIGAKRVVIGSLAVKEPQRVKDWMIRYGAEKIVLALDVNIDEQGNRRVAVSGWQSDSGINIEEILDDFQSVGIKHLLCTDISRDGTLTGSNTGLYQTLVTHYPHLAIQASGGIGTIADIVALNKSKVAGVIVGRALLDGRFDIHEAIAARSTADAS